MQSLELPVLIEHNWNPGRDIERNLTYQYEYDKKGNWTKRIDFENGKAKFILERTYRYYK